MPDLSNRGPLGQKQPKPPKNPRKRLPKISAKRKAYLSSPARQAGLAHMELVAQLPCMVCGSWPVHVHHMPSPRSDMRVVPLCPPHHMREFGPGAWHYSPKAFREAHGGDDEMLAAVSELLRRS